MTPETIGAWLAESLEDFRLSRAERQALAQRVAGLESAADRQVVLRLAFELARERLEHPRASLVLDWPAAVVKTVNVSRSEVPRTSSEACFSPGDQCLDAIVRSLRQSHRSANICVFTITDDRISEEILGAHRRNVPIRIITDNEKAEDLGSDIDRFASAGIAVRVDRSAFHMHHKFAIFDGRTLLTGSYNWTRGAARDNEENLVVTDDPRLVSSYSEAFERLWTRLD